MDMGQIAKRQSSGTETIQDLWTTQTVLFGMDENRFWEKDSRLFENTVRPVYKDHIF